MIGRPLCPHAIGPDFFEGQPNVAANPHPGQPCAFGFVALIPVPLRISRNGPISWRNQYVQQWTATFQTQLASRVSLDMTYLGTKTTHLQTSLSSQRSGAWARRGPDAAAQTTVGCENRGQQQWVGELQRLQVKLETRSWHDLTLLGGVRLFQVHGQQYQRDYVFLSFGRERCVITIFRRFSARALITCCPSEQAKPSWIKADGSTRLPVDGRWRVSGLCAAARLSRPRSATTRPIPAFPVNGLT